MIVAMGRLCYLEQINCTDLSRGGLTRARVLRNVIVGLFLLSLDSITVHSVLWKRKRWKYNLDPWSAFASGPSVESFGM